MALWDQRNFVGAGGMAAATSFLLFPKYEDLLEPMPQDWQGVIIERLPSVFHHALLNRRS
jgi:hypothetical protein